MNYAESIELFAQANAGRTFLRFQASDELPTPTFECGARASPELCYVRLDVQGSTWWDDRFAITTSYTPHQWIQAVGPTFAEVKVRPHPHHQYPDAPIAAIPEPGTYALVALGMLGIALRNSVRRKA